MEHKKEKHHSAIACAHPSLALVKYWGKKKRGVNIPACTSVAVTLSKLHSRACVYFPEKSLSKDEADKAETDMVSFTLNGVPHDDTRLHVLSMAIDAMFHATHKVGIVQMLKSHKIAVRAENNFATSAGLASSASGGAALTLALLSSLGIHTSEKNASMLARSYSGSACRSIFGGFVQWRRAANYAVPLADETHWNDFRVIVLTVTKTSKSVTSRTAMETTRETSAYYAKWLRYNNELAREAMHAIVHKNIEKLGEIAVRSYTAMHATTFAAYPPILYWHPATIAVLHSVHAMRKNNIAVWETMDAGPQVKLITLEVHVDAIQKTLENLLSDEFGLSVDMQVCGVGGAATLVA